MNSAEFAQWLIVITSMKNGAEQIRLISFPKLIE
jgi:hypothetical protein